MPAVPERLSSPGTPTPATQNRQQVSRDASVAYFTMEVALDTRLPTYSGGLGVLAGDFLRSAADLELPLVAVTIAYRDGYFRQGIDAAGHQSEEPVAWDRSALLSKLDTTVPIEISGRTLSVGAWELVLEGVTGGRVTVIFLDTDLDENDQVDRDITDKLYGGDDEHRLRQEAVLGIGGMDMLRELGYGDLVKFHMNEGHSSLLTLRLIETEAPATATAAATVSRAATSAGAPSAAMIGAIRERCVFTTHTPVPAGHDRFASDLVRSVLGEARATMLKDLGLLEDGELNMTTLGVMASGYVNAVARRHREVTQVMMPGVEVRSVTNGVHHVNWAAAPIRELFDEHLQGWREDSAILRYASTLPLDAVGHAHALSKRALIGAVMARSGVALDEGALTIGLARRVTPYKRTMLLFSDPERLAGIAALHGTIQIVCAGKAHPRDEGGKQTIAKLVSAGAEIGKTVRVVFVPNYDLEVAGLACAGTDLWLNTPLRPLEASGTSGMKAAVNGVPSLSILDGWWIEGCVEGVTGWAIGEPTSADPRSTAAAAHTADDAAAAHTAHAADAADADALYRKLDGEIAPMFFRDPEAFLKVRRGAISLNGSFFSTDRMAREYAHEAYKL